MSLYQLQRAMYEFLNPTGKARVVSMDRATLHELFDLTEEELDAYVNADVRTLYLLGVHPVLLNSFARARVPRDQYRAALASLEAEQATAP
jgi:hypothetical protein